MNLRIVAVAPLLLAAVLQAQETPPAQGATAEQQAEKLKGEKQRLEKEIQFARDRVQNASSLLSRKLRRRKPAGTRWIKTIAANPPSPNAKTRGERTSDRA